MSKELEKKKESKVIAETEREKMSLFRSTYGKDLTQNELLLFWNHAKAVGLHPLKKQIYAIKRGGNVTFQTSIDGLRSIAARSGVHAGTDEIEYEYIDSKDKYPNRAKCIVHKIVQGHLVKFVATAKWSEFYPGDKMGHMWRKMPEVMLGKCAESNSLKKAFPEDMNQLYIKEEMERELEPPTRKDIPKGKTRIEALVEASKEPEIKEVKEATPAKKEKPKATKAKATKDKTPIPGEFDM